MDPIGWIIGIIGVVVGILGILAGKRTEARLTALLTKAEQESPVQVRLDRDAAGKITGGQVIRVDTGQLRMQGQPPTVSITPGPPKASTLDPEIVSSGDKQS